MIAKLVVWSDDRLSALRSIRSALSQYHVSRHIAVFIYRFDNIKRVGKLTDMLHIECIFSIREVLIS